MKKTLLIAFLFAGLVPVLFAQTPKKNKESYRNYNNSFNSGAAIDFEKFFSKDFQWTSHPDRKGLQGLKEYRKEIFKSFPDLHLTIEQLVAEGDLVMARVQISGTHKGIYREIPPTNKKVTLYQYTTNRFNAEGKIVESWVLNDSYSMLRQLGAVK